LARQTVLPADDTSSPTLSRHTDPGTVLGTVGYMSPEQVRGQPAGPTSDIFSFGVVFYEMLTGRRAFKGGSAAETMNAILKEEPPDLLETNASLPPALERIVRHCLEKRPEQRFHSAHDVAFDLKALSVDSGTRPRSARNAPINRRLSLGAAALLLVGATVGALIDRAVRPARPSEQPTYRRLTFDRGNVSSARFAPNGNTVVYSATWRGEPSEVFTTRLDSRESRALGVPGALYAVASSTSELAVALRPGLPMVGGTLARVPLAGGAPREVLESVISADWSPDGTELAVVSVRPEGQRVEFPIGHVLHETRGNITHVRISPSGDRVAFIEHPAGAPLTGGSVVAVDRSGAKRTLSSDWANAWGLAWRPDGGEIWFTAVRRGEAFKVLRAVTLEGKDRIVARLLGNNDLEDVAPDGRVLFVHVDFRIAMTARPPGASSESDLTWLGMSAVADLSDDGRRVLFTELGEGPAEGGFTYVRETSGAPAVRLGEGVALALSPDGKWALSQLTSPSRLMLLPVGVGQSRTLTRPGLTYGAGGFFPDGRRVVFTAQESGAPLRVYVQDIDGGEPRPVGPPGTTLPTVAPDGRTIAALAPDRQMILFSIDAGEARPCPGTESGDIPIRWSADGRALFLVRYSSGLTAETHELELATGRRKQLWKLAAQDAAGAFPPGIGPGPGMPLTPAGKSYAYSYARILSDLYLVDGLK
jgi:eukaryotic-like serine/threonine-protein kinase